MKNSIFTIILSLFGLHLIAQCNLDRHNTTWHNSWISCTASTNPNPSRGESHWLMYDLGYVYLLNESNFWNANHPDYINDGLNEVVIDYSLDGIIWEEWGAVTFSQGTGHNLYEGVAGPEFDSLAAQFILITAISNHGGNCYSLAEVKINTTIPIDEDNDGFYSFEDCNDQDASINPNAIELCDDIDNNCDGQIDEDFELTTYYLDADSDGFGDDNNMVISCEMPDDYVVQDGDCDDNNPSINPDREEIVYNGIDDDCDPTTLDDDLDQDGFVLAEDCDDNNPNINSNSEEITYNGIDDDCNPNTLDDDLDQDGFVLVEDCNDADPNIHPNAEEIVYNSIDDDCNLETLDDDLDQDGFVLIDDCDDTNFEINPNAEEIPNNEIDEDCDGMDLVTSTQELSSSAYTIYPNPSFHNIIVEFEKQIQYSIELYDLLGNLILTQRDVNKVPVSDCQSGQYFLVIRDLDSGEKVTNKIIVAR